MINVSKGIRSLSDFKANTQAFLAELRKGEQALILTVNGKAELVAMSAETFQKVRERLAQFDTVIAVKRALEQADRGKGKPAGRVFKELWKELGLPSREEL